MNVTQAECFDEAGASASHALEVVSSSIRTPLGEILSNLLAFQQFSRVHMFAMSIRPLIEPVHTIALELLEEARCSRDARASFFMAFPSAWNNNFG